MRYPQVFAEVVLPLKILQEVAAVDDVSTVTIYDGTILCKKCDYPMTPLEAMYSDDGLCPHCRNLNYQGHAKKLMNP
jgi:hypothetical protein